jgi:hypothetical protein
LTIVDYGNAHFVQSDRFRQVYFDIGMGVLAKNSDTVLRGLGKKRENEDMPKWKELKDELIELFKKQRLPLPPRFNRTMSDYILQFSCVEELVNDAIKIIGRYGDLPFYPKTVDFFRGKILLENQLALLEDSIRSFNVSLIERCNFYKPFPLYVFSSFKSMNSIGTLRSSISVFFNVLRHYDEGFKNFLLYSLGLKQ